MRRWLTLLLAAALALSLAGCAEPAPEESPSEEPSAQPTQTTAPEAVPFSLAYDPSAPLHPITGTSQVNQDVAALVYQGLYELDNTFSAQPVLAKSASVSGDGLTWTVTLRDGVCFSDGTPLTAAQVVSSLTAARSSTLYAARLSGVTSVTASEGAVVITLSEPNGALTSLLDIPVVLEQRDAPAPLGTGRYCYAASGDSLSLAVNPYYAQKGSLPYQEIVLRPVSSADDRIAAFDSGLITAVTTDFSSGYALGYSGSYETYDYPTTSMLYVGFRATDGPCGQAAVRQAFARAFDRAALAGVLLSGHADVSTLPISPLHGEYDAEQAALLDCDPDAAAQLLQEAGYTLGEDGLLYWKKTPLAVTLVVNSDSETKRAAAQRLADNLTALGVTVRVEALSWENYTAALASGSFDLYLGEVRLTGDFDVSGLLTGAMNYGGYAAGEELTQALSAWKAARGTARAAAASQLWQLLAQEVPIAPLCFKRGSLLVRWGMAANLQPTRADPFRGMEDWETVP